MEATARLETFSDGVFAIAATLLILEIRVDDGAADLPAALLGLSPSYAAYAISFLTIGIMTNVAMATMFSSIWFYAATGRRLIAAEADQRTISGISRAFLPGIPLYVVATLSALLSSWVALALYAALAAFHVLESSLFGRDAPAGRIGS